MNAIARYFWPLHAAWHWLRWQFYALACANVHPLHPDLFVLSQCARQSRAVLAGYGIAHEDARCPDCGEPRDLCSCMDPED